MMTNLVMAREGGRRMSRREGDNALTCREGANLANNLIYRTVPCKGGRWSKLIRVAGEDRGGGGGCRGDQCVQHTGGDRFCQSAVHKGGGGGGVRK